MSSNKVGGSKWVSTRVLQQKQQQVPSTTPSSGNAPAGSKIMEDKAIAAARFKDHQGSAAPDTEMPESKVFEVQEATDALSNLAHNADPTMYELTGDAVVEEHQSAEAFHELLMEQVQQQAR